MAHLLPRLSGSVLIRWTAVLLPGCKGCYLNVCDAGVLSDFVA